ncbi:MAG: helix-turn-helix transcriptional regulator [Coriobacteriia bacterium]|nr:helix-turn-helix transcriptional regulator [Coriobacteriia bacterium]
MREQKAELMDFGKRLRELRDERSLTQEKLAHLAGLERTYISQAEQGRRNTTILTLQKLATALEVDITELLMPPTGEVDQD